MDSYRGYTKTRDAVLDALAGVKTSPDVDNFMDMVRMLLVSLEQVAIDGRDAELEKALTAAAETIVQRRSCRLMASSDLLIDRTGGQAKRSIH